MTRIMHYSIQLIAPAVIQNSLFLCDAPTYFSPNSPSLWRSFKMEYVYNKCCPRCAYVKLQYSVVDASVTSYVSNVD